MVFSSPLPVHKIIGFAPSLLQVVMTSSVNMPVCQAGAIYLKNLVVQFWQEKEPPPQTRPQPEPPPFHVDEQDGAMVRDALVDAMVHAPELIRVQLSSCLGCMLKHAMSYAESETSVLLQKLILKIYFALVQYHFPLGLISREVRTQWMDLLADIII
ncbi:hypothetical protein HPB49_007427 [Dermacentor silvarum]|uniref:Uncharacterized protein n=1 Tax=Dermacentor silvarum TaxID=543639 RepID=A0ACB8DWM4_DERSI|nr:hypothetical protein HPB49_007427 [Dermacentor silvarum]